MGFECVDDLRPGVTAQKDWKAFNFERGEQANGSAEWVEENRA